MDPETFYQYDGDVSAYLTESEMNEAYGTPCVVESSDYTSSIANEVTTTLPEQLNG